MAASSAQNALTTPFTPSPSCVTGSFDQLLYRQSEIFWNYPDPVSGTLLPTDCYPRAFLDSYLAQKTVASALPPLAPLRCPYGYDEASITYSASVPVPAEYLVCCPSGFSLIGPKTPGPATRPAFNATCQSPAQTLVVTPYGTEGGALPASVWTGTAGDHAYALPVEGYRTALNVILTPYPSVLRSSAQSSQGPGMTTASASPSSASLTHSEPSATGAMSSAGTTGGNTGASDSLSRGGIAGVVIGSFCALFGCSIAILFLIRRLVMRFQSDPKLANVL